MNIKLNYPLRLVKLYSNTYYIAKCFKQIYKVELFKNYQKEDIWDLL